MSSMTKMHSCYKENLQHLSMKFPPRKNLIDFPIFPKNVIVAIERERESFLLVYSNPPLLSPSSTSHLQYLQHLKLSSQVSQLSNHPTKQTNKNKEKTTTVKLYLSTYCKSQGNKRNKNSGYVIFSLHFVITRTVLKYLLALPSPMMLVLVMFGQREFQ